MSNAIFPDLPGLKAERSAEPQFTTRIQRGVSGAEARAAMQAYPTVKFSLAYDVIRHGSDTDLRRLKGFFLARRGAFDSFLLTDETDFSVTDQPLGTGNGTATQFQLARTWGYDANSQLTEPVMNVNAITNVKVAGTVTAAYTINSTGLITFTTAPAAGQAVTWTGSYYYRARFASDNLSFERFLQDLYSARKVELIASLQNKI